MSESMKYSETSSPEFRQVKIPPGGSFHTSNVIHERWVPIHLVSVWQLSKGEDHFLRFETFGGPRITTA